MTSALNQRSSAWAAPTPSRPERWLSHQEAPPIHPILIPCIHPICSVHAHSPHCDVLLEAGAEASTRHLAHHLAVLVQDLAVLPGRGACRDKADAAARDTLGQLLLDHLGIGR